MKSIFLITRRLLHPSFTLLLLNLLFGCRNDQPENVIFMTLDTQRADFISAYHPGNADTPHIDSLAKRGILFENAYSMIPITLPAHGALFYSLPPHRLGLYNNGQIFTPHQNLLSLAEIFQTKGYDTAAFVSLGVLNSRFGLRRGFLNYNDGKHPSRWYSSAGEVNRNVFEWLDKDRNQPFFLWIHYSDPHEPYAPPSLPPDLRIRFNGKVLSEICCRKNEQTEIKISIPPGHSLIEFIVLSPFPSPREDYRISLNDFELNLAEGLSAAYIGTDFLSRNDKRSLLIKQEGKISVDNSGKTVEADLKFLGNINLFPQEKRDGYKQEVEYLDSQIGLLLARLERQGLAADTLIFLSGDHGEGLGDYIAENREFYFGHIHYLNSIYLRIPMILYYPEMEKAGMRIKTPVTLLDAAPLVLDLMNWAPPKSYTGISPLSSSRNPDHVFFSETYNPEAAHDSFSARRYPWHLIITPAQKKFELYNLSENPEETLNVWEKEKNRPEILELIEYLRKQISAVQKNKADFQLDPESLEMLKALGYIK